MYWPKKFSIGPFDSPQYIVDKLRKEVVRHTNAVFDEDLVLEGPGTQRFQLKQLGFQSFELDEMVQLMFGEPYTKKLISEGSIEFDYVYNHYTDQTYRGGWIHIPTWFYKEERKWHKCFRKEVVWKCRLMNINSIQKTIPEDAILKLLRLKAINAFNAYYVLETMDERPSFLIGGRWELPQTLFEDAAVYVTTGNIEYFFLAEM